jgi:hypothetical protein
LDYSRSFKIFRRDSTESVLGKPVIPRRHLPIMYGKSENAAGNSRGASKSWFKSIAWRQEAHLTVTLELYDVECPLIRRESEILGSETSRRLLY